MSVDRVDPPSTAARAATQRTGRRWRTVRALLAGGLVLGLGATATLAAWTDEVHVAAELGTSSFDVEANTTSPFEPAGPWADHATSATTGSLEFTVAATALAPGDVVHAPLALRTKPGSIGGTVTVDGAELTGSATLGAALRYRLVRDDGDCGPTAFDDPQQWLVGADAPQALGVGSAPTEFPVDAATATEPGQPVRLCFEVSLPDTPANASSTELQGQGVTATWKLTAVS